MGMRITWTYSVSNRPGFQRVELKTLVPQEIDAKKARIKILEHLGDQLAGIRIEDKEPIMTICRTGGTTHQFYSCMDFPLDIPLHQIIDSVRQAVNSQGMLLYREGLKNREMEDGLCPPECDPQPFSTVGSPLARRASQNFLPGDGVLEDASSLGCRKRSIAKGKTRSEDEKF